MLAARSKASYLFHSKIADGLPYLKRSRKKLVFLPHSVFFNTLKSLELFVITAIIMLVDHQYLF